MLRKRGQQTPTNYLDWEKDFGFLNYIIGIKQRLVWSTTIDVTLSKPIVNSNLPTLISDEEVTEVTNTIVQKTVESLSDSYKDFIVKKYFHDMEKFLEYLVETVYYDTIAYTIPKNQKSIRNQKDESESRTQAKQMVARKKEALEKQQPKQSTSKTKQGK